jgi:sarcosine oxidase subunit alpha
MARACTWPVAREFVARCARRCGIFDASTLGKIEVVGPDAAAFLSRMYVNDFASLAVGRCRYGILLRDDGFILRRRCDRARRGRSGFT